MREIALWLSTNLLIADILVLAGSESTNTEITQYKTSGPLKTSSDLNY